MDNVLSALQPDPRILDRFPYPVAYPYSLIFDADEKPSIRRWALCFTEYQLLRQVCLPLVSQYLHDAIDETAEKSIKALNTEIAAIRSPFFSDWISLLFTLRQHLPKVGVTPLFGGLDAALAALKQPEWRPIDLGKEFNLNPLEAILALRNRTAHGGLANETEATAHVREYLPVLHQVLRAFDFLGDCELWVCRDRPEAIRSGYARVRLLRGAVPGEPALTELSDDLSDALAESSAALGVPGRPPQPLYPLLNPVNEQEPLYLYDGHYGIKVGVKQGVEERSYIYYLGIEHRTEDTPACGRLKDLLAARRIHFFLSKDKTAPWTIADSATDYSRRTLDELIGAKYFPLCYLPFEGVERHVQRFLTIPTDPKLWPSDTTRPRYVNGLVLVGLAGSGKTNLLAHQVEQLLEIPDTSTERENRNLVLFLRGNGIALRPEGMSLFRDVAEKLGIAVTAADTRDKAKSSTTAGFSSFRELLDHLHGQWKHDRVDGRRLILVLDALNEAPFAETVIAEALELIAVAASYPWCKVILSTRQEWLSLWAGKIGAQEQSRLEELRPWLYVVERPGEQAQTRQKGPPVLTLEPFTADQVAKVYRRYQAAGGSPDQKTMPACRTAWEALSEPTRDLLTNPLYLHLFMEAFDGREAEPVKNPPALFRRYIGRAMAEHPGLEASVEAVITWLLRDLNRPSADLDDDDCNALRRAWADGLNATEARLLLSPVEGMAHEGFIVKRSGEDGGGYRFVFQTVAESLLYRYLQSAQPAQEDELAYWTRRAQPTTVFPEYAGAFGFLLRDWAASNQLNLVGPLVEAASGWLGGVLTTFLVEQAHSGHVPGQCSAAADAAARALEESGAHITAIALLHAACKMADTSYIGATKRYIQACVMIQEPLMVGDPNQLKISLSLAIAYQILADLMLSFGHGTEAETNYRSSLKIHKALWKAHPDNLGIGGGLIVIQTLYGDLLRVSGRYAEAKASYQRCLEIGELLHAANPANNLIGLALALAYSGLGTLYGHGVKIHNAKAACQRSVEIGEILWATCPHDAAVGNVLLTSYNNLAGILRMNGYSIEAETAYRRGILIGETLRAIHRDSLSIGYGLAMISIHFVSLLCDVRRNAEAEAACRRSVEIIEQVWAANPKHVDIGDCLARAYISQGNLLRDSGRNAEAEAAYRHGLEIHEAVWTVNPKRIDIASSLSVGHHRLFTLLRNSGRHAEANESFFRMFKIIGWRICLKLFFEGLQTILRMVLRSRFNFFGRLRIWL